VTGIALDLLSVVLTQTTMTDVDRPVATVLAVKDTVIGALLDEVTTMTEADTNALLLVSEDQLMITYRPLVLVVMMILIVLATTPHRLTHI
jgi:hypothetical protein